MCTNTVHTCEHTHACTHARTNARTHARVRARIHTHTHRAKERRERRVELKSNSMALAIKSGLWYWRSMKTDRTSIPVQRPITPSYCTVLKHGQGLNKREQSQSENTVSETAITLQTPSFYYFCTETARARITSTYKIVNLLVWLYGQVASISCRQNGTNKLNT